MKTQAELRTLAMDWIRALPADSTKGKWSFRDYLLDNKILTIAESGRHRDIWEDAYLQARGLLR